MDFSIDTLYNQIKAYLPLRKLDNCEMYSSFYKGEYKLELRNLKTFQLLAEYLSYTEVAKKLNFTQPTITAQIQALEQELEEKLLYRVGKQNYLTPAGKLLKKYTDEIFTIIEEMEAEFTKLKKAPQTLNIAAPEYYCIYYFPNIISKYLANHEGIHIHLRSQQSEQVIAGVTNNEYDLGVIAGKVKQSGLMNIVLEEEEFIPVVSSVIYEQYSLEEIIEQFPFIKYRIDGGFQTIIDNFVATFKISPRKTIEIGSEEAIRRAIMSDVGYSLLSKNMIEKELKQGEVMQIPLTTEKMLFQTSLIYLEVNEAKQHLQSFRNAIQQMWLTANADSD